MGESIFDRLRHKAQGLVDRHRLPSAILLVIVVAVALTMLNMWLYVHSGASGLDLSRPGYDVARENVRTQRNEPQFSAEGPLTRDIIDSYLSDFRTERIQASQLGSFQSEPLSNEALGFDVPDIDAEQAFFQ